MIPIVCTCAGQEQLDDQVIAASDQMQSTHPQFGLHKAAEALEAGVPTTVSRAAAEDAAQWRAASFAAEPYTPPSVAAALARLQQRPSGSQQRTRNLEAEPLLKSKLISKPMSR